MIPLLQSRELTHSPAVTYRDPFWHGYTGTENESASTSAVHRRSGRAEDTHGGRPVEHAFLTRKWSRELDYRLIKELWVFRENRIAVRCAYECCDDSSHWFRSYGNENWDFDENSLMRVRIASINDLPIEESERKYHWPLGRRPDDHPSLSDLGL